MWNKYLGIRASPAGTQFSVKGSSKWQLNLININMTEEMDVKDGATCLILLVVTM